MSDDLTTALQSQEVKPREVFYDIGRARYWTKDARGVWIPLSETQCGRLLQLCGFDADAEVLDPKSVEHEQLRIQFEQNLDYCGPLAGYAQGRYEMLGQRLLVTSSPRLIEPRPGDWPILRQLIANLLVEGSEERRERLQEYGVEGDSPLIDQREVFFGWLKVGLEALRANKRHPGQALVIAGERDCGKSLLQSILTELFGGRAAKPYRAMTDATIFNSDMFGAEHLVIGDEACRIDMRSRKAFATQIKGVVAETVQRMEAKHRDALTLTPFWRLSISLNLEPENILVLPPVDEDIADKLILVRAYKRPLPWQIKGPEDREPFWQALMAELPAFVHWLLTEHRIPEQLHSRRFGITHYHHPEILAVIDALSAQEHLLELIDKELFGGSRSADWEGTALELETFLKHADSSVRDQARDLLSNSNSCGAYLGKLARKYPRRIRQRRSAHRRAWLIRPPTASGNDASDTRVTHEASSLSGSVSEE